MKKARQVQEERQAEQAAGVGGQSAQPDSQSAPPVKSADTAGPTGGPAAADVPASTLQDAVKPTGLVGRRIVNIGALTDGIATLMAHTKDCWQPSFVGERRKGLELFLLYQCHKCGANFNIAKEENAIQHVNSQAVYAAVTTGSGFSAMEAQMALMDIPFMSFKQFSELEEDVGEVSYFNFILVISLVGMY